MTAAAGGPEPAEPALLEAVGVTGQEERVYRALVRRPRSTVPELAAASGRSVENLRRLLPRLQQLGLVSQLPGTPARLLATRPDVAVAALVSSRQQELARTRSAVSTLLEDLPVDEHTHAEEFIESVHGKDAVAARFLQLQQTAQEELLVLDRPPYVQDPTVQNPAEPEVLARTVRVRGIYAPEALEIPGALALAHAAIAAGEEARVSSHVPIKLAIADRRTALLPQTSRHAAIVHSALIVHESTLLDALLGLFERLWRDAVPLPGLEPAADADAEQAEDARLLALLAAGLKDEAIARQLGISLRTVHRRTSRLMDRLDARTRFQAGAHAVRRGWLPPASPDA